MQERQILDMESQLQSLLGKGVLPEPKLGLLGKSPLVLMSEHLDREATKPVKLPPAQPSPRLRFMIPRPETSGEDSEVGRPHSAQSQPMADNHNHRQLRAKAAPKSVQKPNFSNSVKLVQAQEDSLAGAGEGGSGGYLNSGHGWGSTRRRSESPGVGLYEDALGRMKRTAQR
jgi:hypothetical protein